MPATVGRHLFLDEPRARLLARACRYLAERTRDGCLRAELAELLTDLGHPLEIEDDHDPGAQTVNQIVAALELVFGKE